MRKTHRGSLLYDLMCFATYGGEYAEFARLAERATVLSCNELTKNPQFRQQLDEDQLTEQLVLQIKAFGLDASHDKMQGGHCDLFVRSANDDCWIAEAKIWDGAESINEGYLQLTTRYLTGQTGHDHGGILIYCFTISSSESIEKWRQHLVGQYQSIETTEETSIDCCFRTRSNAQRTGRDLHVVHLAVPLMFDPQDKSGRKTAARRAARSEA